MPAAVTALARTHERSIVRCREPANNAVQKCDKIRLISDFPACYIFLALCDTEVRSLASHALLFALLCKPHTPGPSKQHFTYLSFQGSLSDSLLHTVTPRA